MRPVPTTAAVFIYDKYNIPISWNVYKKRNFKACEARETAAYYGVCEDFERERNAEITFLDAFLIIFSVEF